MRMYDVIAKKRAGGELTREEIAFFLRGYVDGKIPDYQASALLMAICLCGMTPRETADLTLLMADSGEKMDLSSLEGVKADKHSTGGVGDKTTLVVAPLVASFGIRVPKMSGRGLGYTGGTIDKLESIPGLRTNLSRAEFLDILRSVGTAVASQSDDLVPADRKLYALRDVTATVDSIPLIASSILSKKIAAGADRLLLDVKAGSGAFMKTRESAVRLAETMVEIGWRAGIRTEALVTNMDSPLGRAVGNSLEVTEACETLRGGGPPDVRKICLELSAGMLRLAGYGDLSSCRKAAEEHLDRGDAWEKFREMVRAQGGDTSVLEDPSGFPQAKIIRKVLSPSDGFLGTISAGKCGKTAVLLGAGREEKGGSPDPSAGLILLRKPGDRVHRGDPVAEFHTSDEKRFRPAEEVFLSGLSIREKAPEPEPLLLYRVTRGGAEKLF